MFSFGFCDLHYFYGMFVQEEDFSLLSFVAIVLYFLGTKPALLKVRMLTCKILADL